MKNYYLKLKSKLIDLSVLFKVETSFFQKLTIIYKYIYLVDKDPIIKDILQSIFDKTIKNLGKYESSKLDKDNFLDINSNLFHDQEFWQYYFNLERIYREMKKYDSKAKDKVNLEELYKLLSSPYSKDSLELSFEVINYYILEEMDKKRFKKELENKESKNKLSFNENKSILMIKDYSIKIAKQRKITNEHKLLVYIFNQNSDNLADDFYYSEIAEFEFNDLDYYKENINAWKRYYKACESINEKVRRESRNTIIKFLIYNSGRKGRVKINKKYL